MTNAILDDVVAACAPRYARMTAAFNVRGGTYPTIITEYRQTGWTPAADSASAQVPTTSVASGP